MRGKLRTSKSRVTTLWIEAKMAENGISPGPRLETYERN